MVQVGKNKKKQTTFMNDNILDARTFAFLLTAFYGIVLFMLDRVLKKK